MKRMTLILAAVWLWSAPLMAAGAGQTVFVVHFSTGPAWQADVPPMEQDSFREHSANLRRLREQGDILFGARYGAYGMIFLQSDSIETATAELDGDPGVVAGIFVYQIEPMNIFYSWRDSDDVE